VREVRRIGDDVIVGIGPKAGGMKLRPRSGNIGGDAFEALGFAIRRRVLACESSQAGMDLRPLPSSRTPSRANEVKT